MSGVDNSSINEDDSKLTLISMEQERYVISKHAALTSELIRTIIESDTSSLEIPLPHVKGSILSKVVEYMKHHVDNPAKEIEKPLKSPVMSEIVDQWDADFIDIDQEQLFDIILAASYLQIASLLSLGCAKVASMIKNKNADQIRSLLQLQNDFTKEEEEAISAESRWAEER